jgi:PIN domain nuclease of toxin-antitoxin system
LKLLLDTHALLWFAGGEPALGGRARAVIADRSNLVMISAVSLWEAGIKVRIGKLEADVAGLLAESLQAGFALLDLRPEHVLRLMRLPAFADHRDPFDHLLLAQAATEGATFVTADRNARRYGIPVLRAR